MKTAGSSQVCSWTMATTERHTGRDGEAKERVDWHLCEAWGKTADLATKYLHKGDRVLIEGRIRVDVVEKGGEKKRYHKIQVDRIEFAQDRKDGGDRSGDSRNGGSGKNGLDDIPF